MDGASHSADTFYLIAASFQIECPQMINSRPFLRPRIQAVLVLQILMFSLSAVSLQSSETSVRDLVIKGEYGQAAEQNAAEAVNASLILKSLLFTGKYNAVRTQGGDLAGTFPEYDEIREVMFSALLETGNLRAAAALHAEKQDSLLRGYLDLLMVKRSDAESRRIALEIIARFRKRKPESLSSVLLLSKAHSCAEQFQKAMDVLQDYTPKDALESVQLQTAAGDLFAQKHSETSALQEYTAALKAAPKWIPAAAGAAQVYFSQGILGKCSSTCSDILKINPVHPEARLLLAHIAFLEEDYELCRKHLAGTLKTNPNHPEAYALKTALLKLERNEQAFQKSLIQGKNLGYAPYYFDYHLGSIFMRRKKADTALSYLRPLLADYPDDASVLSAIGRILLRRGQLEDAAALLERSHETDGYNRLTFNTLTLLDRLKQFARKTTEHCYLIYDPAVDRVTAEFFENRIEEIYSGLSRQYSYEPSEKCYIFFFPKHSYLAVMTTGMPRLGMPALCVGNSVYCDTPNILNTHLSMNWYKVIRHEMVHVFNLLQTDFAIPHWFTEGLAVFSEGQEHRYSWDRVLLRAGILDCIKPVQKMNLGFYRPEHRFSRIQAYAQGYGAVLFIIKRWGFNRINDFLSRFSRGFTFEAAVKPVLGLSPAEFQKQLDTYFTRYITRLSVSPQFAPEDMPALQDLVREGNASAAAWLMSQTGDERLAEFCRERFGRVPDAVRTGEAAYLLARSDYTKALSVLATVEAEREFDYFRITGLCHAGLGNKEKALTALIKAWSFYRWDPETIYRIARIYRKLNKSAEYRQWMERYITVNDSAVEKNIEYALFLMEDPDIPRAVYILQLAKRANPASPDVRVLLGKCLLMLKRPEEALAEYLNALAVKPQDKRIRGDAAKILRFLGRNRQAEELEHH